MSDRREENIEIIINKIKNRPCMFIGEEKFERLFFFLSGALYNDPSSMKRGTLNNYFKREFHEWVRRWIQQNKNIELDGSKNYLMYIQEVCETEKECLSMFFELAELFFQEGHSKYSFESEEAEEDMK